MKNIWHRAAMTCSLSCILSAASIAAAADAPVSCKDQFKSRFATLFESDRLLDGGWVRRPESNTIIVFVHGIFSNNREAWLNVGESGLCVYWPELVAKDPAFLGAGVFVASYYTSLISENFDVRQAAAQLLSVLSTSWPGHTYAPLQYPNVMFVGHSLGGVVTRRLLVSEWSKFRTRNLGVALMASPAKGSGWADRASWIAEKLQNKMALQLRSDDPILQEIHESFLALVKEDADGKRMAGMEQFENEFLGCSLSIGFCLSTTILFKNIVTENDAGGYFGAAHIVPQTDHSTIVKPDSEFKQSHLRLKSLFQANFASSKILSSVANGPGTLTLVGEKPMLGWRTIQQQTLRLIAYDESCKPSTPNECLEELPQLPSWLGSPKPGDRRWSAASPMRVKLMGGDKDRYAFEDVLEPHRVRVWAKLDLAKPSSVASYERDFTLEEFGEIKTEPFKSEQPICATPNCIVSVLVPSGVRLTRMQENTPMGIIDTKWVPEQPIRGKVMRFNASEVGPSGSAYTFLLAPAYSQN